MLHASAVRLEQGLLLFIGDSGAGKSTLAGSFHQAGDSAISDDCVWIKESKDQITALPGYGGLRLWEDSYSMAHYSIKKRVALEGNKVLEYGKGIPILAVIMLSPVHKISALEVILDRLPHRDAFVGILKQTFQLDPMDLERMTRHVQALGRIIPRLNAYRLSMPHDYALLPLVRQRILETVL